MNSEILKEVNAEIENLNLLKNELLSSPSDRSCVIVAVSYLDELLMEIIKLFITVPTKKEDNNKLFEGYGPLSSFNSKVVIAYRLGLISEYEYQSLQAIRKIRNNFAHRLDFQKLDTIKDKLQTIIPNRSLLPPEVILAPKYENQKAPLPDIPIIDINSARDIFVKSVLCLQNCLSTRRIRIVFDKRKTPDNYTSLLDIENEKIFATEKNIEQLCKIKELLLKHKSLLDEQKNLLKDSEKDIVRVENEIRKIDIEIIDNENEIKEFKSMYETNLYVKDRIELSLKNDNLL